MAWTLLVVAGIFEIIWATGLKYTDGFTRFWPSVGTVVAMAVSMICLSLAFRVIPMGTAYTVWTGIGAVGTVLLGILLFDEPTSALDPELVKEVLDLIKKLRDEKTTMLIVSHEMKFVKEISDKVIVMEKGKILEEGTSGKVFENSSSERVREFLKK